VEDVDVFGITGVVGVTGVVVLVVHSELFDCTQVFPAMLGSKQRSHSLHELSGILI